MSNFSEQDRRLLAELESTSPLSGYGTPEGKVEAAPGRLYVDIEAEAIYIKVTGASKTGWSLI